MEERVGGGKLSLYPLLKLYRFTYEIAPVYILMEKAVMKRMWEAIGWDPETSDGIFAPGGALANLYAMITARHAMYPRSKYVGLKDVPQLCAFTSESSHYSIKSAAAVCGIGTDLCFAISNDNAGRLIPEELEQKIIECKKEGLVPFFVCCTAGTTVYGAMDPIDKVADICERHKLWLHVDAAWGGGLLLSPEHRYKLSGIERANSVTWNPHKLMGALLQCSACLFKQDGTEGFRQQINKLMDLAAYFTQRVRETEGYELVLDPLALDRLSLSTHFQIAPKIKARMMERGTTMVGYQPDKQRPNFFRMIISNQAITREDLDFLIQEIVDIGESL
ncbi:unnamed protein product [Cylicostephanus goldi]|uniref:Glutamate decarboxylase n=1 Tax=Cylicostephanus goldi TaxID=71465 RepID=A0A3P7LWR8_CYLGO|nr:unnamed protein product [Cylicostephanus goldi]